MWHNALRQLFIYLFIQKSTIKLDGQHMFYNVKIKH